MTKKCVEKYWVKNNIKQINKNIICSSLVLLEDYDDETDFVNWTEDDAKKEYFDCGCCDDCECDDNIKCANCGCNCNGDDIEDDYDYDSDDSDDLDDSDELDIMDDSDESDDNLLSHTSLTDFKKINIIIIKGESNEKLVRITLQINVILDNKKIESVNIDLDIKNKTYSKIAKELFKK